jgi:hypothetical protein
MKKKGHKDKRERSKKGVKKKGREEKRPRRNKAAKKKGCKEKRLQRKKSAQKKEREEKRAQKHEVKRALLCRADTQSKNGLIFRPDSAEPKLAYSFGLQRRTHREVFPQA